METAGAITIYNKETKEIETYDVHTGELVRTSGTLPDKANYKYSVDMNYAICSLVREGKTLEVISTLPSMPTLHLMFAWRRAYPDFKKALEDAQKDRAEYYMDKAAKVVEDAEFMISDKDDVPKAKFQFDGYMKLAEKGNPDKFNNKTAAISGALQIVVNTGIVRSEPVVVDAVVVVASNEDSTDAVGSAEEQE